MANKSSNENEIQNDEKLNITQVQRTDPLSQILQLSVSFIAIVLGIIYLKTALIPLKVILPIFCVLFILMPLLKIYECRKLGMKGFAAYLSSIVYLILSAVVIIATIFYFIAN